MYAKQLGDTDSKEAFTKIKSFLEASYGTPRSTALKNGDFVISWILPSTAITLYSNTTDNTTIVYEERSDKEKGKS